MKTLLALAIELSGYTLFAMFYFLRTNTWNGYLHLQKIGASLAILVLLAILLVNVPDVSDAIKSMTGLEVNIENSATGFMTLGFALSGIVSSKLTEKNKP